MDKVGLITGAANGIGKALALRLIGDGHTLFLTDLSLAALEQSFGEHLHEQVAVAELDVTNAEAWQAVVSRVVGDYGRIHTLFNNAGIVKPGWVHQTPIADIDAQVDVNLKGILYGIRTVSEQMVKQGHGHIINTVSLAGVSPVPGIGVYAATKHGVRGMSLSAALELRDKGVYVSAVCPDLVSTNMLTEQLHREETAVTFSGSKTPLTPDDVVNAILKVMRTKQLEIGVPESRRLLARLVSFFPQLGLWSQKMIAAKGAKQQAEMQRKLETGD